MVINLAFEFKIDLYKINKFNLYNKMNLYSRNLEELLYLSTKKDKLVHNLKKNYKENVHYIIEKK